MKKEIIIILIIGLIAGFLIGMVIFNNLNKNIPYYEEEIYQYYENEAQTLEKMRLCLSGGLQKIHTEKNNCLSSCWGHQNLEELDNVCVQCLEKIETANSIIENCIVQTGLD